jgi:predicted O-methyltransferase YrrM
MRSHPRRTRKRTFVLHSFRQIACRYNLEGKLDLTEHAETKPLVNPSLGRGPAFGTQLREAIKGMIKETLDRTPVARFLHPRYPYNFLPAQLSYLASCLDRVRGLPGPVFEIGCFQGATTIWLKKHMDAVRIEKSYIAIDTFRGFLEADVQHELSSRGKRLHAREYGIAFRSNSRRWVEKTFAFNGVSGVSLIQADASTFDFSPYREISFALVDVDLYLPVKNVLSKIWDVMADGGLIVVDDCVESELYDGALQAYLQFVKEKGLEPQIVHTKLGIIEVRRGAEQIL